MVPEPAPGRKSAFLARQGGGRCGQVLRHRGHGGRFIALAKVLRDPYYDAVTVRVFADGLDFTLDASGKVVGGSKTSRRAYTEYWTFLRSSARRGSNPAATMAGL